MINGYIFILCCLIIVMGCSPNSDITDPAIKGKVADIKLTSPAFKNGSSIPAKYTADGDDISPALAWTDVPKEAKTLALICDDPDAPGGAWVHWVMYNIPPAASGLPEAVPVQEVLENGAQQGLSDFKRPGYGGPAPPSGTHRYFFKLYALDTVLQLDPKTTTKDILVKAMEGHIIGKGQLMGTYKTKR
ncbi:MAG: YbhB/YbcL family Raf kinase inhibitor-like protein [Planctomycetota bacterium]